MSLKSHEEYFDCVVKLILIGNSGVGKTAVAYRYTEDSFLQKTVSSTGIDFRVKKIEVNGLKVKVQVWDTAGQERFRSITSHFFRGAKGVMIFYDITNPESFNNIPQWLDFTASYMEDDEVKVMLIGNKCDNEIRRKVQTKSGEDLAKRFNIPFYETSAGTKHNIEEAFGTLVAEIMGGYTREGPRKDGTITLSSGPGNNRRCC